MKKTTSKRMILGIAGLSACALCCLLPIIAGGIGFTALISYLSQYDKLAGVLLLIASIIYALVLLKKRKAVKACNIDCECKTRSISKMNK